MSFSFLEPPHPPAPVRLVDRARRFFREHGKKLWWLHSVYALGLGLSVVLFAQKGFEHARWLAVTIGLAWLLVVVFFRVFGSGTTQIPIDGSGSKGKIRFFVMTYVLKNLYQGMLFFLLPFYWKSTTLDAPNAWFVVLLAMCAVLSTLDVVFDRFLMKRRSLASIFHGVTLFGCLNLIVPALFPETRSLFSLESAAAITAIAVWTLHVPFGALKKKTNVALFLATLSGATGIAYVARGAIPPVPMYIAYEAVGPSQLADGRLAMEVKSLDASVIRELLAVTDVVVPGGKGDRLHHVWRQGGREVHRSTEDTSRIPSGTPNIVRLRSSLKGGDLPASLGGHWSVDVETEDGQLVGRAEFRVTTSG